MYYLAHRFLHRKRRRYGICRACCAERSLEIMLARAGEAARSQW